LRANDAKDSDATHATEVKGIMESAGIVMVVCSKCQKFCCFLYVYPVLLILKLPDGIYSKSVRAALTLVLFFDQLSDEELVFVHSSEHRQQNVSYVLYLS